MKLDKLAAEILQHFPDLKDWKQPELILLAKAIKKLDRTKRKELKESIKKAKQEERVTARKEKREKRQKEKEAKKEERKIIRENKRKEKRAKELLKAKAKTDEDLKSEIRAAEKRRKTEEFIKINNQEEKIRQELARIINEETDTKLKDRLQEIKQKWEVRNDKKLEEERRHWETRIRFAKLSKSKQNILNRMNAKLSKMSINLTQKLIERIKDIKETYERNHPKLAAVINLTAEPEILIAPKPNLEEKPKRNYVRRQQATCELPDPQLEKEIRKKAEVKKRNKKMQKEGVGDTDIIKYIFRGACKRDLLTKDGEKALAKMVQAGDKAALDLFIESNIRLVISIAKKYQGASIEDLIGYGCEGLAKAASRFKANKGCAFSTYATYWIRQSIDRKLLDNEFDVMRIPIHLAQEARLLRKCRIELSRELQREPEDGEIAERMRMSTKKIRKLTSVADLKAVSLEAPVDETEGSPNKSKNEDITADQFHPSPEEEIWNMNSANLLRKEVQAALATLEENERFVIELRFAEEKETFESIGGKLGLSRGRIQQLEIKALEKLSIFFKRTGREGLLKALIA